MTGDIDISAAQVDRPIAPRLRLFPAAEPAFGRKTVAGHQPIR
jgi:hypothetical protein